MPSKKWLDKVEEMTKKVVNGPDFNNHDEKYWNQWGRFLSDYYKLVDANAILELVHMAKNAASVLVDREDLRGSDRYRRTEYAIEASDDERTRMWQDWALDAADLGRKWDHRVEWVQDFHGSGVAIGELGTNPIHIQLVWATVNKSLMVFWCPTSQVVDYELCTKWIRNHFTNVREVTDDVRHAISEQNSRRAKHKK